MLKQLSVVCTQKVLRVLPAPCFPGCGDNFKNRVSAMALFHNTHGCAARIGIVLAVAVFAMARWSWKFDKAMRDLFRLQMPQSGTHVRRVDNVAAVREAIQARGRGSVLSKTGVVGDIVGQDLFLQAEKIIEQAGFTYARLTGKKMLMRSVNASSKRFQAVFSTAGYHQHPIANVAIDIHLFVNEGHAFIIQQIDLIQYDNWFQQQRFAGCQISVDNIERQLG